MCNLQELEAAFDRLVKPRPLSAEEISERLRSTRFKAFPSDEVPAKLKEGWVFGCEIGENRVLLRKGEL